jgi:glycosyltransferase involved in cell wall biosynthesis
MTSTRTPVKEIQDVVGSKKHADEQGKAATLAEKSLVYIIGTHPLLTTTFIDREVSALRRLGIEVRIISARRPSPDTPLSRDQRELQRSVTYLIPVAWRVLIFSHLYFAAMHPRTYFSTLRYLVTRPHPSLKARLKTILHFGEGVYAAYLIRDRRFRELHAHFVDRAATIALVAGRLLDKPYSLSLHAGADIYVDPVLLREKVVEARHVVSCTSHNVAHVAAIAGEDLSEKMSHINHGLDLSEYRRESRLSGDVPYILAVGQLKGRKGLIPLIRACRRLKDENYRFRCRIVGGGPQFEELRHVVAQLGVGDRVTLCGALPHESVIEEYRRATIFVLPCIKTAEGDVDGFPNVVAEAMASRVPIVTSDLPAIRQVVKHRVNGLLVPPGDEEALAASMKDLLDQPALRERFGARGRQSVLGLFDIEANVRRFVMTLWPEWCESASRGSDGR